MELYHYESEVRTISKETEQELTRDEYTEYIYSETCFGEPVNAQTAEDVIGGVNRAIELDARPVFLEGLSARLTQLGVECSSHDTEIMLSEVKQQFQLARSIINDEIGILKAGILDDGAVDIVSPDRLNSLTIDALLGYRYQSRDKGEVAVRLPKRFTESLPNDVTLGKIIKGDSISYEVLRKTLMLLKFCNYYRAAEAEDRKRGYEPDKYEVNNRLMDFYDELNGTLISCGFA